MRKIVAVVFMWILLAGQMVWAAGSTEVREWQEGSVRFVSIAWTSDASGDVSDDTINIRSSSFIGFLHDPETGVTDAYDFTLQFALSVATSASAARTMEVVDITGGQGTNLSNAVAGGLVYLATPAVLPSGVLTPVLAGCGNATSGNLVLIFWEE